MPGYDKYPVFSPDDSMIAFTSMERPGNESDKDRLFVMSLADGSKRYLTEGFDYNAGNVRWADDSTLLFLSPIRATIQLCSVSLSGGPVRVITSGAHDLNAFSAAGGRVVAEMTTLGSPTELFDVNPSDGAMTRITHTNAEIYERIRLGKVEERWVETTDGKRMLVWVVLPPCLLYTSRCV